MIKLVKNYIKNKLRNLFYSFIYELSQDIALANQIEALLSTAEFVRKELYNISSVKTRFEVHDIAISNIKLSHSDGVVLEFGVYKGESINYIAKKLYNYDVYGFDSFEGLPEFWRDGFDKGTFKLKTLPPVEKNVKLIVGLFEDTLPKFLETEKRNVAYLHIDCDLYSSTKTIFKYLKDRIVSGTVIVFDEFFNYPGWQNGEFKAFMEFVHEEKKYFKYLTYNRKGEQLAVQIL